MKLYIQLLILIFITSILTFNNFVWQDLGRDIWWHLKTGELILSGYFINYDYYTIENGNWVNHSWLAQILYYILYTNYGCFSLLLTRLLAYLVFVFLLFSLLKNKYRLCIIFTLFFSYLMAYQTVRPYNFTPLFFYLSFILLFIKQKHLFLQILMLLWLNFNGSPIYLIILYTFFCVVRLVYFYLHKNISEIKNTIIYLLNLLLMASLYIFFNPSGLDILLRTINGVFYPTTDWLMFSFGSTITIVHILLFFISLLTLIEITYKIRTFTFIDYTVFALFVIFMVFSFRFIREFYILIIFVSYWYYRYNDLLLERITYKLNKNTFIFLVLISTLFLYTYRPFVNFKWPNLDSFLIELKENNKNWHILSPIEYSGKIIFYLSPVSKMFVDTRMEPAIKSGNLELFDKITLNHSDTYSIINDKNINLIIIPHGNFQEGDKFKHLYNNLSYPDWKIIFENEEFSILEKINDEPVPLAQYN